eukprot:gnl/Trimastix_PCT/565.p1 GENE.gnl/Trimastix_PCT/565~~gnl/Trimastix_PCT/565.p1  ORF type:complete len:907 (+),score=336.02 gnl/Trimastix_PCT/565:364-2721(+)
MAHKVPFYRANALRVLSQIVDESLFQQVERFFKSSLIDRNHEVCSAGLIGAYRLMRHNPEAVRRWVSEISEAVNRSNTLCQYHALALLRELKRNDPLSVTKLLNQLVRGWMPSPLAHVMLIRAIGDVLKTRPAGATIESDNPLWRYLDSSLTSLSEIVQFEAARIVVTLPPNKVTTAGIDTLRILVRSISLQTRFAAISALARCAPHNGAAIATHMHSLEHAFRDSNKTVAVLAALTLLRVQWSGVQYPLERIQKRLQSLITEVPDNNKCEIIDAMTKIALKQPARCNNAYKFFQYCLRTEGGFEFKKLIIDSIVGLVNKYPHTMTDGIDVLCDFIDDCEFPALGLQLVRMLADAARQHHLGRRLQDAERANEAAPYRLHMFESCEGYNPIKFIRCLFNRMTLEDNASRIAAGECLMQIGLYAPSVRRDIVRIMERNVTLEVHDEVRERLVTNISFLTRDADYAHQYYLHEVPTYTEEIRRLACAKFLPVEAQEAAAAQSAAAAAPATTTTTTTAAESLAAQPEAPSEPEFYTSMNLGPLFTRREPVLLTERETEYVVSCTKHVFENHIVFQYEVHNTLTTQQLRDVQIAAQCPECLAGDSPALRPDRAGVIRVLDANQRGDALLCYQRTPECIPAGSFTNTLRFNVHDIVGGEALEDGFPDQYNIEPVFIGIVDFMRPAQWDADCTLRWAEQEAHKVRTKFVLRKMKDIPQAFSSVQSYLSMAADCPVPSASAQSVHTRFSAEMVDGSKVLAEVHFTMAERVVSMEIEVRAAAQSISQLVLSSL